MTEPDDDGPFRVQSRAFENRTEAETVLDFIKNETRARADTFEIVEVGEE